MNTKNLIAAFLASAASVSTFAAVPEVTSVTMTQANDRLVTVSYTIENAPAVITLDVQTNCVVDGVVKWVSIGGSAVCNAKGAVWRKIQASDADSQGKYTITWRPDMSWPDHKVAEGGARAVVTAWSLDNTPDYMVVDISDTSSPNSQKYYPDASFLPGGILSNHDYRTTKIVMRKIMAKDVLWTMGSTTFETQRLSAREATHPVSLENNYYIGVFEVTQLQWGLIQTGRVTPSYYKNQEYRAMRPVESVCYNEIRTGAANVTASNPTYDWPADPNPASFLGLLRKKTGLDFDLPSEAQWEFAARAGNGATKWGDGSGIQNTDKDTNLDKLGRYAQNGGKMLNGGSLVAPSADCGAEYGTAIVGTYAPNDWGLYDMHGNVAEWCLDWLDQNISNFGGKVNIDLNNPALTLSGATGEWRMLRGGDSARVASNCRSAFRSNYASTNRDYTTGFRLVCTAGLK